MTFETIIFPTVKPPDFDKKKIKRKGMFIGILSLVLLFIFLWFGQFSVIFLVIGIIIIVALYVYAYFIDFNTVLKVEKNGNIKIDDKGFYLTQINETFIPYEKVRFLFYEQDRFYFYGRYNGSKIRTYKVEIELTSFEKLEFFVENSPFFKNRKTCKDFKEAMNSLRWSDKRLYKIIQEKEK